MKNRHKVMLAVPHNGSVVWGTAHGLLRASAKHDVTVTNICWSNLGGAHNALWCQALNAAQEGAITHLAFLHADVGPDDLWVDALLEVMDERDADLVSSVSPVKDERGVTSTGIGVPGLGWSPLLRFTLHELAEMPETFNAEEAGYPDKVLLHNTACWVADLRKPVFYLRDDEDQALSYFTLRDRIVFSEGRWIAQVESEDWFFSRRLHEANAATYVTQRVKLSHMGSMPFRNDSAWGSNAVDLDSEPLWMKVDQKRYIHENGYWLQKIPQWHHRDRGFQVGLVELLSNAQDVVDLGCGPGTYVGALRRAGICAIGLDGNPATAEIPNCAVKDLTTPMNGEPETDWTLCMEVGEHIPREKEGALLDRIAACRVGAVVTWAQPGQIGRGHINCRSRDEVIELLGSRQLTVDSAATEQLKESATIDYLRDNVTVFRKSSVVTGT